MTAQDITMGLPGERMRVMRGAIAGLAAAAVLQCHGVVGIAAPRGRRGRAQVLDDDDYRRGIRVRVEDGNGTIVVDVYVVVAYGMRVSAVAHAIIGAVGGAVQQVLGARPVRVNVNVQGLRIGG